MLADFVSEKSVVVVGCSAAIVDTNLGQEIESYDTVVRCDNGWPRYDPEDVGYRTDVLFYNTGHDMEEFYLYPSMSLVIWLGEENTRTLRANRFLAVLEIPYLQVENHPKHLLTCTNAIELVWAHKPSKLYLVGCDFFRSKNSDQIWICSNLLYNPKVVMADHVKRALLPTAIFVI